MDQPKPPSRSFAVSAIIAGILFYGFLFVISKWFPDWTGRVITNDWTLVLIAAIPMLIVLALFLSSKISEAKFAGVELKFNTELPPSLLEAIDLDDQISRDFFRKGKQEDLDRIIRTIGESSARPMFLLVPIEELQIDFKVMRQYIYKLSEVAPIQYIVFVGRQRRYLGYITLEKFRAKFPRLGIELVLEDFGGNRVRRVDLPPIFNSNVTQERIEQYLDRLINAQWNPNRGNEFENDRDARRVRVSDLGRLGTSDSKVQVSSTPTNVYWFLLENDLNGIPVLNSSGEFIGLVTKERVTQAVILQLLQKSKKAETKE
jgi:hypothetical protein